MKRILKLLPIVASTMLVACEVEIHFGENRFFIPWYMYIIFVFVLSIAVFIPVCRLLKNQKYVCPNCGEVFSPKRFSFSLLLHDGNKRVAKCTKCGFKGFCRKSD